MLPPRGKKKEINAGLSIEDGAQTNITVVYQKDQPFMLIKYAVV